MLNLRLSRCMDACAASCRIDHGCLIVLCVFLTCWRRCSLTCRVRTYHCYIWNTVGWKMKCQTNINGTLKIKDHLLTSSIPLLFCFTSRVCLIFVLLINTLQDLRSIVLIKVWLEFTSKLRLRIRQAKAAKAKTKAKARPKPKNIFSGIQGRNVEQAYWGYFKVGHLNVGHFLT